MDLSPQQKIAVEYIGSPALVVAGAGSGKTRTLTAKISHLINNGFSSAGILAITFTNKAAEEMKKRLVLITGLKREDFPWVRTYHSACYAILKEHCALLGYKMPLQIMSGYHQQKTIKEITIGLNFDKKHVAGLMSDISRAKNSGNPVAYIKEISFIKSGMTLQVFEKYEEALKLKNAVDFDNILLLARNILRDHKDVRDAYRNTFKFILVDEYQDTNNIQEEITSLLLGHKNLFCVGDDWQAVYGFRGSNVNHFLSFPDKYENAKIFRLEQNFRSANEIVQLANELIDYNQLRMEKNCYSEIAGGVIDIHQFYDEFDEARWVARKVESMHDMGIKYDNMVVMYRTKSCSLWFEKIFRKMNIPYRMMGSKGFFERKEILDINCYLLAAFFPEDDVSFERIINTPKRGIGPGMLKKIGQARTEGMSLQDSASMLSKDRIFTPKVHTALTELLDGLNDMRKMHPAAAINKVLADYAYLDHLKSYCKTTEEYNTRTDNIDELIYNAGMSATLEAYLEEIVLVKEDKDEEDNSKGVGFSTVHASKGLEYYLAFIVGLEEDLFPHWRSLQSDEEIQEERRLMYVAVTRAEKYLYITSAEKRRNRSTRRSRFVTELDEALKFQ